MTNNIKEKVVLFSEDYNQLCEAEKIVLNDGYRWNGVEQEWYQTPDKIDIVDRREAALRNMVEGNWVFDEKTKTYSKQLTDIEKFELRLIKTSNIVLGLSALLMLGFTFISGYVCCMFIDFINRM